MAYYDCSILISNQFDTFTMGYFTHYIIPD